MPFLNKVRLEEVNSTLWELVDPLYYKGTDDTWGVPAGMYTDFASVPQLVTWLIPKTGLYTKAAILHDYFCAIGITSGIVSARDADGVFRRVMRELGVPLVRRWLIWTGVRWGAAFNPVRRAGWWRDAPAILFWTVIAAPVAVPATVLAAVGYIGYLALEYSARFIVAFT